MGCIFIIFTSRDYYNLYGDLVFSEVDLADLKITARIGGLHFLFTCLDEFPVAVIKRVSYFCAQGCCFWVVFL